MRSESALDHHDAFGPARSKIMNVIDSYGLERDAGGMLVSAFPHSALEDILVDWIDSIRSEYAQAFEAGAISQSTEWVHSVGKRSSAAALPPRLCGQRSCPLMKLGKERRRHETFKDARNKKIPLSRSKLQSPHKMDGSNPRGARPKARRAGLWTRLEPVLINMLAHVVIEKTDQLFRDML